MNQLTLCKLNAHVCVQKHMTKDTFINLIKRKVHNKCIITGTKYMYLEKHLREQTGSREKGGKWLMGNKKGKLLHNKAPDCVCE